MPKHPALQSIQERLNRLFEETLQLTAADTRFDTEATGWLPPLDIYETDTEIVVTAEVAGMSREDFAVELTDNVLHLRGDRPPPHAPDSFHRVERHHGTFERSFELPTPVDPKRIEATYELGVLKVRLPKQAEKTGSSIRIEVQT